MADKKISALPVATTPLAGTEVLPIVQGGTTDQVSVANLTTGRAVSSLSVTTTQDVTTGRNIVVTGAGTIEQNGAAGGLYFANSAVLKQRREPVTEYEYQPPQSAPSKPKGRILF